MSGCASWMQLFCCCLDVIETSASPLRRDQEDKELQNGEHEALLTAPLSEPPEQTRAQRSDAYDFEKQNLYVMRHGHRQDEADENWHLTAARCWDPPLSQLGRQQAKEAGHLIKNKQVQWDYVITSPFVRCLQTSAEIVAVLGLPQGRWLVSWNMCECLEPRLLLAGREELSPQLRQQPVGQWMWDGKSINEALADFAAAEADASCVSIHPEVWAGTAPAWPETLPQALKRYERGVKTLWKEFEGKNVLLVTHGEALRAAVNLHDRRANVYEVKHTGYVPMSRSWVQGRWGPWMMDALPSGNTGVSWFED